MEKIKYPCPCGGKIKWKKEKVVIEEVNCGILDVEYCDKCGEEYLPDESFAIVEKKLKEKELWGTERKEIKFWKSGKSTTIRVPTKMSRSLGLATKIKKGFIYKHGANQIIIDI